MPHHPFTAGETEAQHDDNLSSELPTHCQSSLWQIKYLKVPIKVYFILGFQSEASRSDWCLALLKAALNCVV